MKHHYPDCQGGPTCNCDEREREEIERDMSDTPETDKNIMDAWDCCGSWEVVDADFAMKLERERDEARKIAKELRSALHSDGSGYTWEDFPWET